MSDGSERDGKNYNCHDLTGYNINREGDILFLHFKDGWGNRENIMLKTGEVNEVYKALNAFIS